MTRRERFKVTAKNGYHPRTFEDGVQAQIIHPNRARDHGGAEEEELDDDGPRLLRPTLSQHPRIGDLSSFKGFDVSDEWKMNLFGSGCGCR